MSELTHFSLCTGIGGIDLAAEWAGFTTVGQCEIDDYASRVLAKNFKGVPNLHDIRTVDNTGLREHGIDPERITLLSAGFPCQPYSLAGKGRGDGDERDLWGEVKRCIGEIKPRWFVGENTPGLFARANQKYFKRILADLAEMGYRVSWGIWGACDVGAPHKRERVFLCAHSHAVGERFHTNEVQPGELAQSCGATDKERIHRGWVQPKRMGNVLSDTASDELGLFGSEEEAQRIASCGADHRERTQANASGQWWQAEPDVGRVADGISNRVDKLRCLGNAVVPQQVYPLLKAIADYENSEITNQITCPYCGSTPVKDKHTKRSACACRRLHEYTDVSGKKYTVLYSAGSTKEIMR